MSRRLLCALAVVAAALLVPALAAASSSATVTTWGKTSRFDAMDMNGGGMGMGDMYAGTLDLSSSRGGKKNGTMEWSGAIVRQNMPGATEYRSVQWRLTWKQGSLSVNGLFAADQGIAAHTHRVQTLYVTGGSGAYFGARGTVTSTTLNASERKFVFHLVGIERQP